MLAYVFWHRPRSGVDFATYEEAQRAFHATLGMPSGCFRVDALPFGTGGGYEDWYLVDDWGKLGELNESAVDPRRRPHHDLAASMSADGWGGVYALVRGSPAVPAGVEWLDKPRGRPYAEFLASLPETAIWQRQIVLGPAPELCMATPESDARTRIWPRA